MTGFGAFLVKEMHEIRRTWRIWVLPGMLLFFAITSPIIALVTPDVVSSLAGSQPGLVINMADPTATDSFTQFLKSLDQIVLIAVVIAGAGVVSGERSSGTAVLALTKPLSRAAFILAKVLAQLLLLVGFTAIGTITCAALTRVLFGPAPWLPFVTAVSLWLMSATLLVVVMTFFSALFPSRGAAAGAGLAFLLLTLLLSLWPRAVSHSFVGLLSLSGAALAGRPVPWIWPVATAALGSLAIALAAAKVFERQEL
jgi:ABC-2 type transport system permease protein